MTAIATAHRIHLIETLLNTVEAERHLRLPLLGNVVDELEELPGLEGVAESARTILGTVREGDVDDGLFGRCIRALRLAVQTYGRDEAR